MAKDVSWAPDVAEDDFAAAQEYLSLRLDPARARRAVAALRRAPLTSRRANDILRATDRKPLKDSDPGVAKVLHDAHKGKPVSPVLVVSFGYGGDIADGYHRASAQYALDPFGQVPCRIAHVPGLQRPV